jgi:hypothetical protein
MDDYDLGVVVSVTSLIMAMAQDNLDAFSVCYQKAVDRLQKASHPLIHTNTWLITIPARHRSRISRGLCILPNTLTVAPNEALATSPILPAFE